MGDEINQNASGNGNGSGRKPIGQLLVESAGLLPQQIADGVERQRLLAEKHRYYLLGRILIGMGHVTLDDVKEALSMQQKNGLALDVRDAEQDDYRSAEPAPAPTAWQVNTPAGPVQPVSALRSLDKIDEKVAAGELESMLPLALGFDPLDDTLGGGIRPGELLLLGGGQGVGKTTMAFQMARNIAAAGEANVLYVCYEHDEENLTHRLISMESVDPLAHDLRFGVGVRELTRQITLARQRGNTTLYEVLRADTRTNTALNRLRHYGERMFLLKGSGARTTLAAITALVEAHRVRDDARLVLFVDYLQKVPVLPELGSEQERVTKVAEGLKELALAQEIPVVAIVAADRDGLKAKRMRAHHLWGGSALAYEADVIVMLAEKFDAVARVHLEFNPRKAERFRDWLICSIEKNRSGRDVVDMEFEKLFGYCCLNPNGNFVTEKLIDERLFTE